MTNAHLVWAFALAPTWADLAWLRAQTRLPILLKGIMSGVGRGWMA